MLFAETTTQSFGFTMLVLVVGFGFMLKSLAKADNEGVVKKAAQDSVVRAISKLFK
jgi:hypothetical protein